MLAACVIIAYAPVFRLGWTTDDYIEIGARHFDALESLPREDWQLWTAHFWERSFVDPVTDWHIFRPVRQWLFWSDYFIWHLTPLGYHITNLILHVLTAFLVALITWLVTRHERTAVLAGVLFALLSIHAAPVAQISSRGHLLAGLFVAMSLFFYLLPQRTWTTGLSLLGFVLALGSKETAVILPILLLLFESASGPLRPYRIREILKRHLTFWFALAIYFLVRLLVHGQLFGSPYTLGQWAWQDQVVGYIQRVFDPFLRDLEASQILLALPIYGLILLAYRSRRPVWIGLLWVPLALLPTLTFRPTDRYFYIPSIGLALALASILANPIRALPQWSWKLGLALLVLLVYFFDIGISASIQNLVDGNQVAIMFLDKVRTLHAAFPPDSKIYIVGLPGGARQGFVFNNPRQPQYALQLLYADPSLQVFPTDHFPFVTQDLQRTFFLQYEDGELADRSDLVQAIVARQGCPDTFPSTVVWDFQKDAGGWDPWNEIEGWQVRDGTLFFASTGSGPAMGSPVLEVPWSQLDHISVRMAAQSVEPMLDARLYWQTADMSDFSPIFYVSFKVRADGKSHTYNLVLPSISPTGHQSPLVRLRLDPSDALAEFRINLIEIECK